MVMLLTMKAPHVMRVLHTWYLRFLEPKDPEIIKEKQNNNTKAKTRQLQRPKPQNTAAPNPLVQKPWKPKKHCPAKP